MSWCFWCGVTATHSDMHCVLQKPATSGLWQADVLFNNLNDLIPLPKCTNEDVKLPESAIPVPHSTTAFYAQVCSSCRTQVTNYSESVTKPF